MCAFAPIALASLALSAGGAIADYSAKGRAAAKNKTAALEEQTRTLNSLSLRQSEETDSAAHETENATRQTATLQGQANLSAAESGIAGNSVTALMGELERQRGLYTDNIAENLSRTMRQLQMEKLGVVAQTKNRITQAPAPSPFSLALRLGGQAFETFTQFQQRKP